MTDDEIKRASRSIVTEVLHQMGISAYDQNEEREGAAKVVEHWIRTILDQVRQFGIDD